MTNQHFEVCIKGNKLHIKNITKNLTEKFVVSGKDSKEMDENYHFIKWIFFHSTGDTLRFFLKDMWESEETLNDVRVKCQEICKRNELL